MSHKGLEHPSWYPREPWKQSQGHPDDCIGINVQPDCEQYNRGSQFSHLDEPTLQQLYKPSPSLYFIRVSLYC